jgi:hypothetical protein
VVLWAGAEVHNLIMVVEVLQCKVLLWVVLSVAVVLWEVLAEWAEVLGQECLGLVLVPLLVCPALLLQCLQLVAVD